MRPFADSERLEPELRNAPDPHSSDPRSLPLQTVGAGDARSRSVRTWRNPFGSALTRRILAVNVLPLLILVGGLLYVGEYRRGLVQSELDALRTQAELIANALGEGTVDHMAAAEEVTLSLEAARHMVRRLVEPTGARARLFAADGSLVADTRLLSGPGGSIYIERLPPPEDDPPLLGAAGRIYGWIVGLLPDGEELPLYVERPTQTASDYVEVQRALEGEPQRMRRRDPFDRTVLSAAVPVQRFKQVLGAVMLSTEDQAIQKAIRSVRFDILRVFAVALASTVLLSLYLGGTIVRPVLRLARAAERVKRGQGRPPEIPQIGRRNDEIADLAESLRTMTQVLWQRLNANERFAADVAHEIKNPLTSLRSAVETAARVKDPDQQRRLMAIIQEDVGRLDRLITDISDASRLDAELSRDATETVDVARLLDALAELHQTTDDGGGPAIRLDIARHQDLAVTGLESRLGQVFRNLIANAVSFSPPGGTVTLRAVRQGAWVVAQVEDEGPGIPPDNLEAIFQRFYSERPSGEKFGTHSGLGLSISKQIVEAHGGTVTAENRPPPGGARFTVRLPSDRR
ncbi:histidine kinase [Allostella sp. ATCC 35155]|nr:histidine kinase [Stella sp. ATCC 35155]